MDLQYKLCISNVHCRYSRVQAPELIFGLIFKSGSTAIFVLILVYPKSMFEKVSICLDITWHSFALFLKVFDHVTELKRFTSLIWSETVLSMNVSNVNAER